MTDALKIRITEKTLLTLVGLLVGSGGVGTYALRKVGTHAEGIEARLVRVETAVSFLVQREIGTDITSKLSRSAKPTSAPSSPSAVSKSETP